MSTPPQILAEHKAKGEEDNALEAAAVKTTNKAKRKAAAKPVQPRATATRKSEFQADLLHTFELVLNIRLVQLPLQHVALR